MDIHLESDMSERSSNTTKIETQDIALLDRNLRKSERSSNTTKIETYYTYLI